jgi:hypothetical protein|tara:strand:- start:1580 stop:3799 length:2220 start_codon:yes stop_codon:yes gene_type:complete
MALLDEGKANTHLTHLEELVLTQGPKGYEMARAFLLELLETLKGNTKSRVQTSVKWDGAPAIFAGVNPENDKFFVGTKSIFNKVPKINYTPQDIIDNHGHAPGLVDKLTKALKYLPELGINTILQGDFMFDDEMLSVSNLDGEPHYLFKPNTIVYAVPVDSDLGEEIGQSKFGIVFHTTYDSLDSGATFGADVSGLKRVPGIWFDDAFFTDDTGTVTLTSGEAEQVESLIQQADVVNKRINYQDLPMDLLNIYINSEIKKGEFLESPEKSFQGFKTWFSTRVEKKIDNLKSEKGKMRAFQRGEKALEEMNRQEQDIVNLFDVSRLLFEAKNIFIRKYNNAVYNTKHFVDDGSGDLVASNPEGYVAVDREGNGVKFVDRLEFSRANFMIDKGDKFQQNESLTVFWGSDGFAVTKSLLEWAENLPTPETKNKVLFEKLQEGHPVTSLVGSAVDVKRAISEAVAWGITEEKKKKQRQMKLPTGLIGTLDFSLNEVNGEVIAVIAGGFKPPHRGHMEMVQYYADMADKVKLFIGKNARPISGDEQGRKVTAEKSLEIWNKYLADAGLDGRVDVEIIDGSPMKASYSVLENASPGETILMGCGAKDTYFSPEALERYTPEGVQAQAAPCPTILDPNTNQPYSATAVRDTIKNNDIKGFASFLPPASLARAEEIFQILSDPLEEISGAGAAGGYAWPLGAKPPRRRSPEVAGSEKKKKRHPKNFIAEEDELVNEVVDYLLGITVG